MKENNNNSIISQDYHKCNKQSEFEQFVIKYNHLYPNHQLLKDAKNNISRLAKQKDNDSKWPFYILVGLVAIAASIGLFMLAFSMEGEPSSTIYHGEHGDYRMTNFKSLLGPIGIIGGFAAAIGGLYAIRTGIIKLNNLKKI